MISKLSQCLSAVKLKLSPDSNYPTLIKNKHKKAVLDDLFLNNLRVQSDLKSLTFIVNVWLLEKLFFFLICRCYKVFYYSDGSASPSQIKKEEELHPGNRL